MALFFGKSGSSTALTPAPLDIARVGAVLKYFPFGTAVRYYPEFKKNIVLESVILGYLLDKTWFFSAQDLAFEGDGNAARLLAGPQRKAIKPTSLSIVIPSQSRGVAQLDYARKEELEKTGGLANGNNITLMAQPYQGKTPVLETIVRKRAVVQEGLYATTPVVLLDVNIRSLQLTDQRAHMRLQTRVSAQVMVGNGKPTPCIMADFSDSSVRLSVDAAWTTTMKVGREAILSFGLPGRSQDVVLRGEIFRHDDNDLVVTLDAIQRDDQFQRIEVIDVLEIKAKLLQLPDTSV